jgi:hypothetical protein
MSTSPLTHTAKNSATEHLHGDESVETASTRLQQAKTVAAIKTLPHVNARTDADADQSDSEDNRNPIFELLVKNEQDVAGLLAYALYKQNKRDWLIAFQATTGRQPTDGEVSAFILGERIPRRTATYRKLAEDMLARSEGKPSLLAGLIAQPANDTGGSRPVVLPAKKNMLIVRYIGIMLVMLVIMAVAFRFVASWLFGR